MAPSSAAVGRGALVAGIALGLLGTGLVAGAADEEPSGPVVVTEAVDDRDVRASLRFPVGWRSEAPRGELTPRFINAVGVDERCELTTRRSDFGDLVTDVDDFVVSLGPGSGFIFMAREAVALPAGPAARVDFAANEEGGRWSVYMAWDDGYVHELWCRGDELPDDRWLSIAQTFEVDPDPTVRSTPFDPRVARPDAGVAMAFPEAWHVRGSSTSQGLLYATRDTAVCALSDYSEIAEQNGWQTVDDMHDEYVTTADGRENLSVEAAGYVDLPAGRTGFADIAFDDGTRAVRWSFGHEDGRLMALFCVGEPTSDGRYRSLAESLEWLSAE